jgi:hypothetical protein
VCNLRANSFLEDSSPRGARVHLERIGRLNLFSRKFGSTIVIRSPPRGSIVVKDLPMLSFYDKKITIVQALNGYISYMDISIKYFIDYLGHTTINNICWT